MSETNNPPPFPRLSMPTNFLREVTAHSPLFRIHPPANKRKRLCLNERAPSPQKPCHDALRAAAASPSVLVHFDGLRRQRPVRGPSTSTAGDHLPEDFPKTVIARSPLRFHWVSRTSNAQPPLFFRFAKGYREIWPTTFLSTPWAAGGQRKGALTSEFQHSMVRPAHDPHPRLQTSGSKPSEYSKHHMFFLRRRRWEQLLSSMALFPGR